MFHTKTHGQMIEPYKKWNFERCSKR